MNEEYSYINNLGYRLNNNLRLNLNYSHIDLNNIIFMKMLLDMIKYGNDHKWSLTNIKYLEELYNDLKQYSLISGKRIDFCNGILTENGNYILTESASNYIM